ncbi:MAG: gliding motility-associated C-terminal domain-containing protein [Candidatus Zixiibacteriota bacterium]
MKTKKICLTVILILISSMALFAQPEDPDEYASWKRAYLDSMRRDSDESLFRTMAMYVENDYVQGVMDERTGEFEEGGDRTGTASYEKLTFSWDHPPGTGYIIYAVDDHDPAKTAGFGTGSMPDTDASYTEADGTLVVEWHDFHGVNIKQTLSVHSLGYSSGENEQVKFETSITSADGDCHDVGCLVFYDTMLDGDDAAEISTSAGYTGISEIFFAPDIPAFWRAYEDGYPPGPTALQALGILWGYEATMPDVFWYGQWSSGSGNGWPDSDWIADSGSPFGDSATMVKWYQRRTCVGDTTVFATYYGIGELLATTLYSTHTPMNIESNCDSLWPNPDSAEVLIVNGGTSDAEDIQARFIAPPGLNVLSTNPLDIGSMIGYGDTRTIYWEIEFLPETYGDSVEYSIEITYGDPARPGERDTVYNEFQIGVPVGPFSINAYADDSSLCLGQSTMVHVDIEEGGSEYYNVSWHPSGWCANDTARETWIYPDASRNLYIFVQDEIGCMSTDTIAFTILEPPTPPVNISPYDGETALPFEDDQRVVWNASEGYGSITYTVYYWNNVDSDTMVAASGINDTFTTFDTDCSREITWYVVASNECGDTPGEPTSFETIPCGNPVAHVVHPFEDAWSSCADQEIVIFFEDSFDIDTDSYQITVNGNIYRSGAPEISASPTGDTMYFHPDEIFTDGMHVEFTLDSATNIYGVPIEPISSSFDVDLSYPEISDMIPMDHQMVLNNEPDISFTLEDEYAGLEPDLTSITINGDRTYDMSSSALSRSGNRFTFSSSDAGERFIAGDTVYITVECGDAPDYCEPNMGNHVWQFNIEPKIECLAQPNPFTPNDDEYNDIIVFDYPFMFSEAAELKIFNKNKTLIYEERLNPISSRNDYERRRWLGTDNDGKKLSPGLYFYTISRDNEVICEGTLTLIR